MPKSISESAQNTLLKISLEINEKKTAPTVLKTGCYLFALPNPGGNRGQIPTAVSRSQYHISVYFFPFCSLSASQPSPLSHQADAPSRRQPSPAGIAPGQPARDPRYMAHAQASQEPGEKICFPKCI